MNFIRTYFGSKIGAIGRLLDITQDAIDQRIWLAVILTTLWTVVCTIGGLLLFPIDIIYSAIKWYKCPEFREVMKAVNEEYKHAEE